MSQAPSTLGVGLPGETLQDVPGSPQDLNEERRQRLMALRQVPLTIGVQTPATSSRRERLDRLAASVGEEKDAPASVRQYKAWRRLQESTAELEALQDETYVKDTTSDEERLVLWNDIRRRRGLDPQDEAPSPTIGFFGTFGEEFSGSRAVQKIPFGGAAYEGYKLWDVYQAVDAVEEGTATPTDWEALAWFNEQAVADTRDKTFGGQVAQILANMPTYGVEIGMTFGTSLVAKGGAKVGMKAGSAALRGMVTSALRTAGTTAWKTPAFFSPHIAAKAIQEKLPDVIVPDGEYQILAVKPGTSWAQAIYEAGMDTYIELVSEQTGGIVGVVAGKIPGVKKLAAIKMSAADFLRRFGYHMPVGELAEERIAEGLRYVSNQLAGTDLAGARLPTLEQIAAEAVAFTVPAGAAVGISKLKGQDKLLKDYEERIEAGQADPVPNAETWEKETGEEAPSRPKRAEQLELWKQEKADATQEGPGSEGRVVEHPEAEGGGVAAEAGRGDIAEQGRAVAEEETEDVGAYRDLLPQALDNLTPEAIDAYVAKFEGMTEQKRESLLNNFRVAAKEKKAQREKRGAETQAHLAVPLPWEVSKEEWGSLAGFIPAEMETVSVDKELVSAKEQFGKTTNALDKVFLGKQLKDLQDAKKAGVESFERPKGPPPPGYMPGSTTVAGKTVEGFHRDKYERAVKKKPKAESRLTKEAKQARKEMGEAADELGRYTEGKTFANPLADPQLLKLTTKLVNKSLRAGVLTFADFVRELAEKVGAEVVRGLMPSLQKRWTRARGMHKNLGLDEAGDVAWVLDAMPDKVAGLEPRLAATETKGVREVAAAVDALRTEAEIPFRMEGSKQIGQRDPDVWAAGIRLLEHSHDEYKKKLLAGEQPENAAEMVAYQGLVMELDGVIGSGDAKAVLDATHMMHMYRQIRTELARSLRQGHWETRKTVLLEALLAPPIKTARKIDKAKRAKDYDKARELLAKWAEEAAGPYRDELMAMGIDVTNLDALLKDRKALGRALRLIATRKADYWDKQFEWYSNSLLSGPLTTMVNLLGTSAYASAQFTIGRFSEALVDTALRNVGLKTGGARFSELKALWRGVLMSQAEASHNFVSTFRDEFPVMLEEATGKTELRGLDVKGPSIKGFKGRVIRAPWRSLSAADDYMMTSIAHAEAMRIADRMVRDKGFVGEAIHTETMKLYNDRGSAAWAHAYRKALDLTFKTQGDTVKKLLGFRRIKGMRYMLPFVTTPTDLITKGVRHSPVGILGFIKDLKERDANAASVRLAEQVLAWSAVLALIASMDPDDPWITGSKHPTHPYSIRIGDKWYSYARIDPFATALALTVDIATAMHAGATPADIQVPFRTLVAQADQKTYLQSFGDIFNVVNSITWDRGEPFDVVSKFAGNFFTGFVPNVVRAPIRATKGERPERKVWGPRTKRTDKVLKRVLQGTEVGTAFSPDAPKIDLWGRERMRDGSPIGSAQTDFLWRLLIPAQTSKYDDTVGDRMLYHWNRQNPDEPYKPRGARPYVSIARQKIWFTDEQFQEYQMRRGRIAHEIIRRYVESRQLDPVKVTKRDIDVMKKAFSAGSDYARGTMIRDGLLRLPRKAG